MGSVLIAIIYLAFISLGLPDSLMGAAWPTMSVQFGMPLSYAGIVTIIITSGTVISSLMSDRLTAIFGAGKVTAVSVVMTAVALFGFSASPQFWILCLWAIPYGLGAGAIDAALNNYVALHYSSQHMSWLHGMWGVGTIVSPFIMTHALVSLHSWQTGYRYVSYIQCAIALVVALSLPLWKNRATVQTESHDDEHNDSPQSPRTALRLRDTIRLPHAWETMVMFFAYCALEGTVGLWASSYMVYSRGISTDEAAQWASYFFLGITAGRLVSGFVAAKFNDATMIRIGLGFVTVGLTAVIIPIPTNTLTMIGLILIGVGSGPIYPSVIHSTPEIFGEDKSQAMIGVQMASAYLGSLLAPPVFGLLANATTVAIFPYYVVIFLIVMVVLHERIRSQHAQK